MKELKSHTLDFDALEGWCGNFYTRRTQISKTRVLLLILHFWETEKKKEGEEEERRKEEEEDTLPTAKPNPPAKKSFFLLLRVSSACSLNLKPKLSVLDSRSTCTKNSH